MATPKPLYTDRQIEPAYQLRYNWTGWPSGDGEFPEGLPGVVEGLRQVWEADGMRALEVRSSKNLTQALFSVRPEVSPILCTTRAKGRLQHALRREGRAVAFSRKLALRSVGENTRADVEQYIASQVGRAPVVERDLLQFSVADPSVDLSGPTETLSGRYWYNLHLVLVTQERYRVRNLERLGRIRDQSLRIAQKKGCAISRLAVMPDHLHAAMRGNIELSPQDIALAFQNNLAYALGQCRLWQDTYYVGTFGEYDMSAIRHCVEKEATHGQPANLIHLPGEPAGVSKGPAVVDQPANLIHLPGEPAGVSKGPATVDQPANLIHLPGEPAGVSKGPATVDQPANLIHLPGKPAGVSKRPAVVDQPANLIHLPGEPAGVSKGPATVDQPANLIHLPGEPAGVGTR